MRKCNPPIKGRFVLVHVYGKTLTLCEVHLQANLSTGKKLATHTTGVSLIPFSLNTFTLLFLSTKFVQLSNHAKDYKSKLKYL